MIPPPSPPPPPPTPPPPPPPPPPSSAAASPSHEFSFTISFQPPPALPSPSPPNTTKSKEKEPAPTCLSPPDGTFIGGQLLQIPQPASPPRPSDITLENFSLTPPRGDAERSPNGLQQDGRTKTKSRNFSALFGLGNPGRRSKRSSDGEKKEEDDGCNNSNCKKKVNRKGFSLGRLLKKYASMVEPLFFFRGKKAKLKVPARSSSSGANTGVLTAPVAFSPSGNSTMEELQSAIQAAIAHCKNSVAPKQQQQQQKINHVNAEISEKLKQK